MIMIVSHDKNRGKRYSDRNKQYRHNELLYSRRLNNSNHMIIIMFTIYITCVFFQSGELNTNQLFYFLFNIDIDPFMNLWYT